MFQKQRLFTNNVSLLLSEQSTPDNALNYFTLNPAKDKNRNVNTFGR